MAMLKSPPNSSKFRILRIVFGFTAVEAFLASGIYYAEFLSGKGKHLSLSSAATLGLLIGSGVLLLFALSVLIFREFENWLERYLRRIFMKDQLVFFVSIGLVLLIYESFQDFLFLGADMDFVHYQGYRRLLGDNIVLLISIFFISVQALLVMIIFRRDWYHEKLSTTASSKWFLPAVIVGFTAILMDQSSLAAFPGIEKSNNFGELPTPLLGLQVVVIIGVVVVFTRLLDYLSNRKNWLSLINSDGFGFLLIALLAYFLWIRVPIGPGSFMGPPRPPNQISYPVSDALDYEISAHSLLAGNGLGRSDHVGYRIYLAMLHFIAGDGAADIYPVKIMVLSFSPALLYLLVKTMHNRFSGMLAAGLFIVRESSAIRLNDVITVVNVKDIMTEPLTQLSILLTMTLLIFWWREKKIRLLLLSGGALGWTILLRVETATYFAVIGFGLLLYFWKNWKSWLQGMLIFTLGMVLVMGPWMVHAVVSQGSLTAAGLGREGRLELTIDRYQQKEIIKQSGTMNKYQLFPHHLVNGVKSQLYFLPINHQPLISFENLPEVISNQVDEADLEGDRFRDKYLERYVRGLPYWRSDWDGHLEPRSYLPLLVTLGILVIGYHETNQNKRWFAWTLVGISLAQFAIYAFIGRSGGRLTQVTNWISLVYYGIGVSYIIKTFIKESGISQPSPGWFQQSLPAEPQWPSGQKSHIKTAAIGIVMLLIGCSLPAQEYWIPSVYTEEKLERVLLSQPDLVQTSKDQAGSAEILLGKALYPRYFPAGMTMEDDRRGKIPDPSSDRIEFFLVGMENIWVTLPGDQKESVLPHGSEVVIAGTKIPKKIGRQGYLIYTHYIQGKEIFILPPVSASGEE